MQGVLDKSMIFSLSSKNLPLGRFSGLEPERFLENSFKQNLWVLIQFRSKTGNELESSC